MQESRKRPESPNTNSTFGTSSKKNRSVRTDRSSEGFFVSTVARGAGSGIRTHEGVTPNGCRVLALISRDLEAVALTTQPSRREPPLGCWSYTTFELDLIGNDCW